MKQQFETPVFEIIEFAQEDVIRTSNGIDTPGENLGGGSSNKGDLNLPIDPF